MSSDHEASAKTLISADLSDRLTQTEVCVAVRPLLEAHRQTLQCSGLRDIYTRA